jgi:hypothetical protein
VAQLARLRARARCGSRAQAAIWAWAGDSPARLGRNRPSLSLCHLGRWWRSDGRAQGSGEQKPGHPPLLVNPSSFSSSSLFFSLARRRQRHGILGWPRRMRDGTAVGPLAGVRAPQR